MAVGPRPPRGTRELGWRPLGSPGCCGAAAALTTHTAVLVPPSTRVARTCGTRRAGDNGGEPLPALASWGVRHRRGRRLRDLGGPAADAPGGDLGKARLTYRADGQEVGPVDVRGALQSLQEVQEATPPGRTSSPSRWRSRPSAQGAGAAGSARLRTAVGALPDPAAGLGEQSRDDVRVRIHAGTGVRVGSGGAGRAHAGRRRAGGVPPGRRRAHRAHGRRGGHLGVGVGEDPARGSGRPAGRARSADDPLPTDGAASVADAVHGRGPAPRPGPAHGGRPTLLPVGRPCGARPRRVGERPARGRGLGRMRGRDASAALDRVGVASRGATARAVPWSCGRRWRSSAGLRRRPQPVRGDRPGASRAWRIRGLRGARAPGRLTRVLVDEAAARRSTTTSARSSWAARCSTCGPRSSPGPGRGTPPRRIPVGATQRAGYGPVQTAVLTCLLDCGRPSSRTGADGVPRLVALLRIPAPRAPGASIPCRRWANLAGPSIHADAPGRRRSRAEVEGGADRWPGRATRSASTSRPGASSSATSRTGSCPARSPWSDTRSSPCGRTRSSSMPSSWASTASSCPRTSWRGLQVDRWGTPLRMFFAGRPGRAHRRPTSSRLGDCLADSARDRARTDRTPPARPDRRAPRPAVPHAPVPALPGHRGLPAEDDRRRRAQGPGPHGGACRHPAAAGPTSTGTAGRPPTSRPSSGTTSPPTSCSSSSTSRPTPSTSTSSARRTRRRAAVPQRRGYAGSRRRQVAERIADRRTRVAISGAHLEAQGRTP